MAVLEEPQVPVDADPARVLLVDGHAMFAELLAELLATDPGFFVVGIADSGHVAIEVATQTRPEVIVIDSRLPGEDGVTIATRLRHALPDAQIVILAGEDDAELIRSALAVGCAGVVARNQGVAVLVETLRSLHAGRIESETETAARLAGLRAGAVRTSELTAREAQVLAMLAEGLPAREIAAGLFISPNTVRNHVQRLIVKLGAHSRLEAVAIARRRGLLHDEQRA